MCKLKFINVHLTKASSISVALPIQRLKSRSFHHMKNGDPQQRVAFSENLLNRGEDFLKTIVFSDESTFSSNGKVSTYNASLWGSERPRTPRSFSNIINETHQSFMCSAPCP